MGKVKEFIGSLKNNFWNYKIDNNQSFFIDSLRKRGVSIGENVLFVKPSSSTIDLTSPYLISIGDNVCVSKGLSIFTHDYSSFVERMITGEVLGGVDKVSIGSNIQIGANVTILMGTIIEDNVIIAAGAVCRGHLESGYVYGGVPAKRISTIESFVIKRRQDQFEKAKIVVCSYYKKYGKIPDQNIFYPLHIFPLFLKVDEWPDSFWNGFGQRLSKEKIASFYQNFKPMFDNYDAFIAAVGLKSD